MSDVVIQVDRLWKKYRLGMLGTGTLRHDFNRWLHRTLGKPDPYAKVGEAQRSEERRAKREDGGSKTESRSPLSALRSPVDAPSPIFPLPSPSSSLRDDEMWALRDVSFEVKRGEILGIIGRNGAGKSTLLKVLSRVTAPTTGEVRVKGRIASLLEVGTGFHPELTGRENIFLNGAILGMTKAEIKGKLDEIVAFAEIEKFLDTPVKRYSSGMYVRLAFAVAAHLEPEILIVDEVLAVGDSQFQKKCLGKMGEVARSGRTVLFVSHSMVTIQSLCERVVLLVQGELNLTGPPNTVIPAYLRQGVPASAYGGDLRTHPGRRNSREIALIRAWVETGDHLATSAVVMGEPVFFCFEFRCKDPVSSPIFGFAIEDGSGRRVFALNNLMRPEAEGHPKSVRAGIARMYLARNLLLPGNYFISASIMEGLHTYVDFVEQAAEFSVDGADVYGSGRIPQPNHGSVFVDGEIQYQPIGPLTNLPESGNSKEQLAEASRLKNGDERQTL
jgi:lipopolysaccharide transport system ATP-binding protein